MNAIELTTYIDRTGTVAPIANSGWRFNVRVVNARISYGGLQLEVEPIAGTGRKWVDARKVTLTEV